MITIESMKISDDSVRDAYDVIRNYCNSLTKCEGCLLEKPCQQDELFRAIPERWPELETSDNE